MQKLGILASVLLLASVMVGPIGLSHAQTVDTNKASKAKHEEIRSMEDQKKAERLAMQIKKAEDARAKMNAKKMAAAAEIAKMIEERNKMVQKDQIPRTADFVAKLKEAAKEQIEARKAAGGPSKVQKALEEDRAAYAKRIAEHKMKLKTAPDKDHKYTKDDKRGRDKTLKQLGAIDQYSKESELKKQDKKAISERDEKASQMHYNRK
ncbi:MAG: hypothetical protein WAO91_06755 [Candidatus Nitrosotenuis sp.]